jgi:hypothetical protein
MNGLVDVKNGRACFLIYKKVLHPTFLPNDFLAFGGSR